MTVLQALALAEGANPTANLHKAKDHPEKRKWQHRGSGRH
jgi:hypothetical protein